MHEFAYGESVAMLSMLRALLHEHPKRAAVVDIFNAIYAEEEAHALATSPSEARLEGLRSMHTRLLAELPATQRPPA